MKPTPFDVTVVATVEEACEALAEAGSDGKLLAGGQSLVPMLNFRLARPTVLVDLNRVRELQYVREEGALLCVGAMTRLGVLETHVSRGATGRLLAAGLPHVGHVAIRNRGTVGGSLAHADPAAELCAISLALEARFVARSRRGMREIVAEDFFQGPYMTCLQADEMVVEVRFPAEAAGTGSAFLEVARRHGDFAIVGVAASIAVGARGLITGARLAYASMGLCPLRARSAEAALVGQPPRQESFAAAAEVAVGELDPGSDLHASRAYRLDVARALTRRALAAAVSSAAR